MPNSPLLSLVFAAPLLVAAPAHAKPAPKEEPKSEPQR